MKKIFLRFLVLMVAVTSAGCATEEVDPKLSLEATREVLIGRWSIERIDFGLCKNATCNATYYTGTAQDYFEFRADSAFLKKMNTASLDYTVQGFKVDYTMPAVVVLTNATWSGRFEVVESKLKKLVLKSSFTGRDPAAVFTDTYYLYK